MPAFIPANGAIEAAISIAVLVIAFIGWLMQIVGQSKGNQQNGPGNRPRPDGPRNARPQAGGGKRDDRLRNEIDAFLQEVSGGRAQTPRNERDEEVALEILPDDEPREQPRRLVTTRSTPISQQRPPTPKPAAPAAQLSTWDLEQKRRREKVRSGLSERHLTANPLGRELREHVEQFAEETHELRKEKEQAEHHLAEARAELKSMRAQIAASPAAGAVGASSAGGRFAMLLKNRKSVKDAIVINEVLSRPRALRRS